jgi:hypothetical protein
VPTDVCFFLKAFPGAELSRLPWKRPTKMLAVDPTAWFCGGVDPRCSSAYSGMYAAHAASGGGNAMPSFLATHAKGLDVGRVAFLGHSAAHGFLAPLLANDADRARVDAVLLLDATFGGGKAGYVKMGVDAVAGRKLFVTTTANTGGDCSKASYQDVLAPAQCVPPQAVGGWVPVFNQIVQQTGATPKRIPTLPPMPEPSGGVTKLGDSLYWWRFVNATGGSELPHWEQGKVTNKLVTATLLPYWNGEMKGGGGIPTWLYGIGAAAAVGLGAWALTRKR